MNGRVASTLISALVRNFTSVARVRNRRKYLVDLVMFRCYNHKVKSAMFLTSVVQVQSLALVSEDTYVY